MTFHNPTQQIKLLLDTHEANLNQSTQQLQDLLQAYKYNVKTETIIKDGKFKVVSDLDVVLNRD